MTPPAIKRAILDLAVEDSYALPEVLARVSGLLPETRQSTARAVARAAVLDMVGSGLLTVVRQAHPGGPEIVLKSQESVRCLADDLEWVEGDHWRAHCRIVATKEGRETYESNPSE